MKFRDPKTGEVFEDIEKARTSYCSGKDCDHDCEIAFKRTTCSQWAKDHPAEAARLMGLEVVEEDVDLINRISKTPLTESEVYTFSMRLCDNEVDRDWDWFSTQALEKMSEMFIGKRGILGHLCSARIYRTELVRDAEKTTAAGDEYCCLKGWAYMLRNEQGKDVIAEIEAGIKKEVSVGCAVERSVCSICGADIGTCPHVKGKTYDGWLCFAELRNPTDVYEWSVVATPAKKKEEPMDKMDKPRIAQVLGVEVEEDFCIRGLKGSFKVVENGTLGYSCEFPAASEWVDIINHPDRIIRQPRFTEEEVAAAKILLGAGAVSVYKDEHGALRWKSGEHVDSLRNMLPIKLFPSLRPGQAVKLEDIVGDGL